LAEYWLSVDAIALSASTAKSVLEIAAGSNDPVSIVEWWGEFDGTSSTAVPVKVEVGRFSAGVTTATTGTAEKRDTGTSGGGTAATVKHTTTTEGAGTADDIQFHRVPPTSGLWYIAPMGREVIIAGSGFWRMRLNAAATVNATVGVVWQE